MKRFLLLAAVVFGVWMCARPAPAGYWSGRPGTEPLQTTGSFPAAWTREGFTYQPLARFAVKAVVLSRERYRNDPGAKLAPVDLALGWGAMSDAAVINALHISQDHRWYNYSWTGNPPIDPSEIGRSSANMHMIPASPAVRAALLEVKRHELVELSGYLVEIRRADGWHWRSSTSREDTGGGACEVVWVEALTHRPL
jgi:hypothetical protein